MKKFCPHCRKHQAAQGNQVELGMAPGSRGAAIQGRRFNGRPAVSKTASGGSNPSAPANHPANKLGVDAKEDLWLPM